MSEIMDILDDETYEGLKRRALKDGLTIDLAIRHALKEWLMKEEDIGPIFFLRKDHKRNASIVQLQPFHTTKSNTQLSKEIDRIMYGV